MIGTTTTSGVIDTIDATLKPSAPSSLPAPEDVPCPAYAHIAASIGVLDRRTKLLLYVAILQITLMLSDNSHASAILAALRTLFQPSL